MTPRRLAFVGPFLAIAAITTAACNWNDSGSSPGSDSQTAARPAQPDAWLTTQVQARYFTEPALRGSGVAVATEGGVVTLTGRVPNAAARAQAVTLAQQVDGVARVEDQLEVEPVADTADASDDAPPAKADEAAPAVARDTSPTIGERFDAAWTTTRIQAQYFADPDVKGRNIDVTTDASGRVTLRGPVESEAARNEAMRIARETPGVRGVADELRIEPPSAGPAAPAREAAGAIEDGWITAKIQSKYFLDPEVKGREIDVDTKEGVVTLSGQVEKAAERRQAVAIARNTDGVREVEDRLTVPSVTSVAGEPGGPGKVLETPLEASKAVAPPDGWITTTIQSKFFLAEDVRAQTIEVATAGGVVTLRGRVDTDGTRKTAETIARETRGVQRVVNQLTVGAGAS